jgi:Flp pilus assembly protein TadD/mono/diheme cytochrome c family protein
MRCYLLSFRRIGREREGLALMNVRFFSIALLLLAGVSATGAAQRSLTFNGDIAPIIYKNCAPCHRPGESGPFSLLSYEDVKRHASQIVTVTKQRYMPPWLPEAGYGDFADERRLSDKEIALIAEWVQQGARQGTLVHAPAPPTFTSEWQLGPPDMVLHVTHPYQVPAAATEIFWNFILPVPVKAERWVRAIEVRPGNPKVFHHANVIIDRSGSARRRETKAGIGFPGMDLTVEETTFDPDGHFLSWKPGSTPVVEPDGMAWRATPGMDLVLNVHLRPTGKPEIVDPEIGIYFTEKPQTRYPMLIQLEHDGAIDIKPGDHDYLVSDDFRCPDDLNVLAIYPHAHYLAKVMEGYATLPDGSRKWLLRIPNWDLSWQGVFLLKKPLFLPKGTVVSMRYHYDNSNDNVRNPNNPPKEVKAGIQSTDEMGHFWLQVLPAGEGDRREILQAAVVEDRLKKYPNDFAANYNMGDILLTKGDAAGAIRYFGEAGQANPDSPLVPMELGVAYYAQSKLGEAEQQFRKALQIDSAFTDARFNLASVEAEHGDLQTAVNDFRQVLLERSDYPKARDHLGDVLFAWGDELAKSGDNQQAAQRYEAALQFRPRDVALHTSLGAAFARMGQMQNARAELTMAVHLDPSFQPAQKLLLAIGH